MVILILDSGVYSQNLAIKELGSFRGYSLEHNDKALHIHEDFSDEHGHGTGIYHIIRKNCPSADIVVVKIFDNSLEITEDALIAILTYIRDNEKVDIINLSLGINMCEKQKELYCICNDISANGTIIVSAFDNNGAVSYPAAFDCVIGVDSAKLITKDQSYANSSTGIVNMWTKGSLSRVAWRSPEYIMVGGTSFACAYATAIIANQMIDGTFGVGVDGIRPYGISNSTATTFVKSFDIRKAALFPFNKEMHSLVRFADILDFDIEAVCDIRLSGRVGMSIRKILGNDVADIRIQDVTTLAWDEIDTLILGHTHELSQLINNKELRNDLIKKAVSRQIKIYSFDPIDVEGYPYIFYPRINLSNVPSNAGKLHQLSTPVLGVFGTSSQQGKFTLQLLLRKLLKERGYSVGQLGTEPSALLYGMDDVFPYGYNSTAYVGNTEMIATLNDQMWRIAKKNYEIIIVGAQSGTIPYALFNLSHISVEQLSFLYGTCPDAVILAINPHDDVSYIKRTITFIESTIDCKVIGASLFPVTLSDGYTGLLGAKKRLDYDKLRTLRGALSMELNIPVYLLGEKDEMTELADTVIDFFDE